MIPGQFVIIEEIPLNTNGKVDRKRLPEPGSLSGGEFAPPRNDMEKEIVRMWSQVLHVDVEGIGIDTDFFQLGGHSLRATTLISKIHKQFHVRLPLSELFRTPSVRELARYIKKTSKERFVSIEAIEKKEYYPLSTSQQRLYILQQMEHGGTGYNIPMAMRLKGKVDPVRIKQTFKELIERHESLRTTFQVVGESPVQRVHDKVEFKLRYSDKTREPQAPEAFTAG
ncbi:MAG: hypothetical protein GY757_50260, partial [bacterium]|nr:hypothetical protein [bacterium]